MEQREIGRMQGKLFQLCLKYFFICLHVYMQD